MAISKIKVGSTEHELQTTIANVSGLQDALDDKATKSEGIFFIEGTGTTAGTWKGTNNRITEYYDGLTIKYKINIAGASTTTLNINNLGAKTVYLRGSTKLTTHFEVNSIIMLTYHASLNSGCWIVNDYDSNTNTYQRVYESSDNTEYAITTRYNTTDGASYYAEYGRYTNGVTLNPSTNTVTASTFKGDVTGSLITGQEITVDERLYVNGDLVIPHDDDVGQGCYIFDESPSADKPVLGFLGNNADEEVILRYIATPEESYDAANKKYVDDAVANAGGGSGSSGTSQLQIPITYSELKSLRDNSQLIPATFYRITDYQCTTVQENTRAMDNKFDIIVQALSANTLSENASADYHIVQTKSAHTLKASVINGDNTLVDGAVVARHYISEDYIESTNLISYFSSDAFVEYDYLKNNKGYIVPVLYKNGDGYEDEGTDYAEPFYYVGTEIVNGVTYDKWRKIIPNNSNENLTWDSTAKLYLLTDVIVESGDSSAEQAINGITPDVANIPAWEIKYCLDNDNTRFAWAWDGQAITNLTSAMSNGEPLTRQSSFDNSCPSSEYSEYIYAWGTQADVDDGDFYDFIYSKTAAITTGDTVFNASSDNLQTVEVTEGKGVIYHMKDEHGNECPYDFKNIQFKRDIDWQNEHVDFIEGLGISVGDVEWFYTFSWINDSLEVEDLTLRQDLTNDEEVCIGTYLNKISPLLYETALELNNNIFINSYQYDGGMFYGCQNNTFGNDCLNNTFGNSCANNTFENECYNNTFGNDCLNNTFGNGCANNTFGHYDGNNFFINDCHYNIFGNECTGNTFGSGCMDNTFGNVCMDNTFGVQCTGNTFENYCCDNVFGNSCHSNRFGSNCIYITFGISCWHNIFNTAYIQSIKFADRCQFIRLINEEAGRSSNYIQDITVSAGVHGTRSTPLELQVSRNAAPVVYEAAGTTHIILD